MGETSKKPNLVYHQLDEPFFPNPYGVNSGISALHDLYPGRPMTTNDSFLNQYLIPNEDPAGARRTFLNSTKDTREYAKILTDDTMEGNGGDKNKVLIHAVDDPSSVINNPDLQSAQMMTPESLGEGSPIEQPPKVKSPIVEGFEEPKKSKGVSKDENSEENFDPFITNIIFLLIVIFAIIFLVGFVTK